MLEISSLTGVLANMSMGKELGGTELGATISVTDWDVITAGAAATDGGAAAVAEAEINDEAAVITEEADIDEDEAATLS